MVEEATPPPNLLSCSGVLSEDGSSSLEHSKVNITTLPLSGRSKADVRYFEVNFVSTLEQRRHLAESHQLILHGYRRQKHTEQHDSLHP